MKIGIIGLGLIGGSILKKLHQLGHELYAVTGNPATSEKIKGIVASASENYSVLKDCEMVFVCTPIRNTLESLDRLENVVSKDCIVTDVASVKDFLTKKKRPYKFIPSHPMAGKEHNGYDYSEADLFVGAKWAITPYDCQETDLLTDVVKSMGAIPIMADSKEHDVAVALISHFPMYLSQCVFAAAMDNPLAMKLASSGFRDTTRVAGENLTLAKDMLNYNGENIRLAAEKFKKILDGLKDNYTDEVLEPIQKSRRAMYSPDGKNLL